MFESITYGKYFCKNAQSKHVSKIRQELGLLDHIDN